MWFARSTQMVHHFMCKTKAGFWFAIIVGILAAVIGSAKSSADIRQGIHVEIKGRGPAMVFIPGLNSSSATFQDTCEAFKQAYTCHLLHLPGFAGQPPTPAAQAQFLVTMREAIGNYIRGAKLNRPIFVGHSLGGVLSLMLAAENPDLIQQLILVDALPFYPAVFNPALTPAEARTQAEQMRSQMKALSAEEFHLNAAAQLAGMSNNPSRIPLLTEWSKTSDRTTTSQAMYDLMTLDLRDQLGKIKAPTLVLGSWAGYKAYGATKESTQAIFASQYAQLKNVDIRMSANGFHFLTWDDPQWVADQITAFISSPAPTKTNLH